MKKWFRELLLSSSERHGLAISAAFAVPEDHLYYQNGELWNPRDLNTQDLHWGQVEVLGWIQGLQIQGGALLINHFAVQKHLVRCGLGTRLVYGFRRAVKQNTSITELVFTQYNQSAAHDKFFVSRLGAIKQTCRLDITRSEWVWNI